MTEENVGKFQAPMSVPIYGEERTFATARDVLEFAKAEESFWSFLGSDVDSSPFGRAAQEIKTNRANALSNARKAIDGQLNPSDENTQIRSPLERAHQHLPPASTPLARYIKLLHDKHPDTAFTTLAWMQAAPKPPHKIGIDSNNVTGAIAISRFNLGLVPGVSVASREALEATQVEWNRFTDGAKARQAEHENQSTSLRDETARFRGDLQTQFDDAMAEHKKAIEDIEDRFRKKMSLREPVAYWATKATEHIRALWALVLVGVALGVAAGFVLWSLVPDWLLPVAPGANQGASGTSPSPSTPIPSYFGIAFLVGVAAMLLWPVRVVIKLALGQLHLANDAREREMMIKTFLSMNDQSDNAMKDGERAFALAAVFRPASDGFVKDDASPLLYQEMLKSIQKTG